MCKVAGKPQNTLLARWELPKQCKRLITPPSNGRRMQGTRCAALRGLEHAAPVAFAATNWSRDGWVLGGWEYGAPPGRVEEGQ